MSITDSKYNTSLSMDADKMDYTISVFEKDSTGNQSFVDKRTYYGDFEETINYAKNLMHRLSNSPSHSLLFNQKNNEEHKVYEDGSYELLNSKKIVTGYEIINLGGDRYDGGLFYEIKKDGDTIHKGVLDGEEMVEFGGKKYDGLRKLAEDLDAKLNVIESMADGGMMAYPKYLPVGVSQRELNKKIKDWYIKNYPTDDLGQEIDDRITFKSFWAYSGQGYDPYEALNVADSLVRERVEEKLSAIFGNQKMFDGGMMAKGGKIGFNVGDIVELKEIPENFPKEIRKGLVENKWKVTRVSMSGRSLFSDVMEDIFGYDIELADKSIDYKAFVYPNEIKAYKMADGGMMAKGGEIRYKLKGVNFGQQIENGKNFKALISKVFENQSGENKYPQNLIQEIAYTGKIVKNDGSNYLKDYSYKGTLTKFEFLDDKDFIEALKYVDRPAIKTFKFEDGGMMADGGKIYEVGIDNGKDGTRTLADFETEKDATFFMYEYNLKNPNAKLFIDTVTSDSGMMAKGGETKVEDVVYIQYRNAKKKFAIDKKYFRGDDAYMDAVKWGRKNIPNFNMDMVTFEIADGGMMAKGGYVAVAEKDGYWTIISKPTTKEKAEQMLGGIARGEEGKVVTLEEAKAHKKVIGREYLAFGGMMAKGGKINLGDVVEVKEPNYGYDDSYYVVDNKAGYDKNGFLISATRKRVGDVFEKEQLRKLYGKGGYMADGGETTVVDEFGSMSFRNQYDEYEMVVVSKELEKDGGSFHKNRFLVIAKDIDEAKNIATELWQKEFGDSDLSIVKVMSDSLYKLKYMDKYAGGGLMEKGGELNINVRKLASSKGFNPKVLGRDYQEVMAKAVVAALTDANYHSEARKLVSILEKNPKIAEKPNYPSPSDPKFREKMDEIEKIYGSEYFEADEKTTAFARKVSEQAEYDGFEIANAFEYVLRMEGQHKLANDIIVAMAENNEMAHGGEVTLWEIEDNKATKLKTDTPRAIKIFYNKLKNERLKLPTKNSGIQEWDSDITEEEVLKYNRISKGSATSQEFAKGGALYHGLYLESGKRKEYK
jgi:hypothetical protein